MTLGHLPGQLTVGSLDSLRQLTADQLGAAAAEIRSFLVQTVCGTGGHLGPNLGVVELTMALHRVFDSPRDRVLFDTGHQAYVHKILTGRRDGFLALRQEDGISGYPSQAESVHDVIENSHASTALSYADGLAKAYQLRGETDRAVVAVVGDGAMTGGMCWEALNNIGEGARPVLIVFNDNGRSYAPTSGGLAIHMRHRSLFTSLGLSYLGPVDGHDVLAIEAALREARSMQRPVVVHCKTIKGFGYRPAELDEADCLHGIGVIDPVTGRAKRDTTTWTDIFADEIVHIGEQRPDVVCLTASMLQPVGLKRFADRFPDRVFDVGIAEQHAVASAAGLALGGMHPVVAIYATFLNRAFDQVVMDVALHRLAVTFVLDRAGVTGPDGASHHGMWDLPMLALVPGLRVAAPRDTTRLRELLHEAVATTSGPTVVRFPKASAGPPIEPIDRIGNMEVLLDDDRAEILIVAIGPTAADCLAAADQLGRVKVVDPRWVIPADRELVALAGEHRIVLTVEDGSRTGGAGALLAQAVTDAGLTTPVHNLGLPRRFLPHGDRRRILDRHGFAAESIVEAIELAKSGVGPYRHEPDQCPQRPWQN